MKMPLAVAQAAARFDRLSVRERILVASATLVALVIGWTIVVFDPTSAQERALAAELAGLQESISAASQAMQSAAENDATAAAMREQEKLEKQLADINAQLASESAGLIPPERTVQVIHDVLSRQHGVTLVTLHNQPVTTLVPPQAGAAPSGAGPYVHSVELVVEGRYLDVLAYLRALERLEWRFYWKLLELETTEYPMNRIRIELSTLSLDQSWIGV
jgi:MSHA biogenesis protein MshJ